MTKDFIIYRTLQFLVWILFLTFLGITYIWDFENNSELKAIIILIIPLLTIFQGYSNWNLGNKVIISLQKSQWIIPFLWIIMGVLKIFFPTKIMAELVFEHFSLDQFVGVAFMLLGIGIIPSKLVIEAEKYWILGSRSKQVKFENNDEVYIGKNEIKFILDERVIGYKTRNISQNLKLILTNLMKNNIAKSSKQGEFHP